MRQLAILIFLAPFALSAPQAQYRPVVRTDTGAGDDGQYHPDNSGQYVPDNAGAYVHQDVPYRHQEGPYGPDNGAYRGSGDSGGGGGGASGAGAGGGRYVVARPVVTTARRVVTATSSPVVVSPTVAAYSPTPVLRQGNAQGLYENRNYKIVRLEQDVLGDGYHYLYETENGILAEEEGHLIGVEKDKEAMQAKGFFTYTGPDNVVYRVDYTADENGFNPVGEHLPTPPPIPEAIVRSLEYLRANGKL